MGKKTLVLSIVLLALFCLSSVGAFQAWKNYSEDREIGDYHMQNYEADSTAGNLVAAETDLQYADELYAHANQRLHEFYLAGTGIVLSILGSAFLYKKTKSPKKRRKN